MIYIIKLDKFGWLFFKETHEIFEIPQTTPGTTAKI